MSGDTTVVEAQNVRFYVATDGSDTWSGRLPKPNAAKTDGPFATVMAARDAVRKVLVAEPAPASIEVMVRGGIYPLAETFTLTDLDRGLFELNENKQPKFDIREPRTPVVWTAYKNEEPVLSGGRRIAGWKEETVNGQRAWVAHLPEVESGAWRFRQLWVNGERRFRPRLPKQDGTFFRIEEALDKDRVKGHRGTQDRFVYAAGDINPEWKNLTDVEVHIFNYWIDPIARIASIDAEKRICTLDRQPGVNLNDEWGSQGANYVIENVFEELRTPGQWYLDRPAGLLYYLPKRGETLRNTEVIAPALDVLMRIEGSSPLVREEVGKQYSPAVAGNLVFRGITFSHSEYQMPDGWAASNQSAVETSGAVTVKHAQNVRFEQCAVRHVGAYGLHMESCLEVAFEGGDVADTGAGGIKVWHGCRRVQICDNDIGDGGNVFAAGVGVIIGQSTGVRVIHNHIHDFYYSGVSVGWRWGYAESNGYGNIIEWNHIHDIGKGMLSDMGGIYCLGAAPGTRLRFNRIHDIMSRTYGGWGLYTDEGSTHVLIENNIAYNTKCGGFHQHYGAENEVRNNILGETILEECQRSRLEPHESFVFERNLMISTKGHFWKGNWDAINATVRSNLYWRPGKPAAQKEGRAKFAKLGNYGGKDQSEISFAEWQKRGLDTGSFFADPKFVNPAKGDFRLKKGSPAAKVGFIPFDLSAAGVRPERRERGYTGGICKQNSVGMWG